MSGVPPEAAQWPEEMREQYVRIYRRTLQSLEAKAGIATPELSAQQKAWLSVRQRWTQGAGHRWMRRPRRGE